MKIRRVLETAGLQMIRSGYFWQMSRPTRHGERGTRVLHSLITDRDTRNGTAVLKQGVEYSQAVRDFLGPELVELVRTV